MQDKKLSIYTIFQVFLKFCAVFQGRFCTDYKNKYVICLPCTFQGCRCRGLLLILIAFLFHF